MSLVQKLNRDGVEEVSKHRYDKAEALFLKAYLYDPEDPFTLNNLGYVSEMEGQLDRAHHYYELASQQESDANIDRSDAKQLKGKPMTAAFDKLQDVPMRCEPHECRCDVYAFARSGVKLSPCCNRLCLWMPGILSR